jgi:hypothetical protein
MDDIDLDWSPGQHQIGVKASYKGELIVDLNITDYAWEDANHRYQAFMTDASGSYMATIIMQAQFSENEEERGTVTFGDHEFTAALDKGNVNTTPFRELWMRDGLQTFHPLEQIARPGA